MYEPRKAPYLLIASIVYWEQVGVNLHDGGNSGEMSS